MSTAATASPSFQHSFPAVLSSSASSSSTVQTPTPSVASSPSVLPFHRRQLPATPIHTSQLPIPTSTATYSPLSSGLPSPNFPSPIPLPAVLPSIPTGPGIGIGIGRGRSPAPSAASSRQPSRQQSIRRLSSLSGAFSPIIGGGAPNGGHGRRPSHAASSTAGYYPLPDVNDFSTIHEDILSEGDVIGVGDELHGETIELVNIPTSAPRPEQEPPATRLEVVRKLGAGSYAVVYLVREIVARTPIVERRPASPEGDLSGMLSDSSDDRRPRFRYTYGREFAVKCLAKSNLSPEELDIQMFEALVHQSLPTHPNIVTLYRTLQTPSYLLLVLESVPGQDLYYFLEQSRDHVHFDSNNDPLSVQPSRTPSSRPLPPVPGALSLPSPTASSNSSLGNALMITSTPPTPSLLSTLHPQHQFSYQRLRLITSMFSQMCDAVDACHSRGVSHRDIKPENFIVTEGLRDGFGSAAAAGERKVVVKLSDFGLATMQQESADVDCGSAPYMSYECRNNVAPTYATQPADVWSLGIVLINMLYHHNPWSDTASLATTAADHHRYSSLPSGAYPSSGGLRQQYACESFQEFLGSPVQFFLRRFPGMTMPVADFLANRVFCILPRPNILDAASGMPKYKNIGQRCTARELGEWIKSLPVLMGQGLSLGMGMGMGVGSRSGMQPQRMGSKLAIESWRNEEEDMDGLYVPSGTPVPPAASTATLVIPEERTLAPAHPIPEEPKEMTDVLSTSPADHEAAGNSGPGEGDADGDGQESLRSPSTKKRGKRGARRKDKSLPPSTPSQNPSFNSLLDTSSAVPPVPSGMLTAAVVENFASEISRSTAPVLRSSASRTSVTSGRSTGRSRLSTTEKLVARLPPPPSVAPPAPPVEGVTVKKYQELGRRISMEEEVSRGGSPRPPSVISQASSVPISISSATKKNPPSPPNLFSPLHHYRPNAPKDAPPKPPVSSALAQQHPGAAAILSSQPALPSKKSWMGRLLSSGNSASTNSSPPPAHAAPGAHQSPATLSSSASRASMSSSSLASSTMESAARSGLLIQDSSSSRMGPSGTVRAPSRTSVQHPNMQWASTEDDLAPRVNDLDVMPPPTSTSWRKNPPPGAQWSTSEEGAQARAAAAAAPPNGTPKPPPVHGFISSAVAFNAEQRRRMDSPWRSSVMSNATTASSGSGSIVNSAGVLSSASSTFTRFSNGSARSVSTTATSASAMSKWGPNDKPGSGADGPSWRPKGPPMGVDSGFVGPDAPPRPRKAPMQQKSNVKRMDGIPWELNELPRVHQPRVKGVLSDMPNKKPGYAQQRGHRSSPPLDPISEKNNSTSQSPPPSPDVYRSRDGTTSTTDLDPALDAASSTASDPRPSPDLKKQGPQKTQSNAFQKFSLFKAKQRD